MKPVFWTLRILSILMLMVWLPATGFAFTAADFIVSPTEVHLGTVRVLPASTAGPYAFSIAVVGGPIPDPPVPPATESEETATFYASSDAPWLTLDPANGTAPGSITASATVSETMGSGTWTANVTIMSGLDPSTEPVTITVSINVIRSIGDLLTVSPTTLNLRMTEQSVSEQTFPVTIANADPNKSTGYLWSAQSDVGWLVLSAFEGSGNTTVSLKVDPEAFYLNTDTNGDGVPDEAVGTITFRSTLHPDPVTLKVTATLLPTTEHSVSPAQLFWTVEKSTAGAALSFPDQLVQVFGFDSGWTASCDLGFVSVSTESGEVINTDPYGWLKVTPNATMLSTMDYGTYTGYVTISDLDRLYIRRVPVIINIRRPGEAVNLPIPEITMSPTQIKPYYSMMDAVDSSLINVHIPVPTDFVYHPTAATCQAAGGTWMDPDNISGNLNEYCSSNQHTYLLLERSEMAPGKVYALTKSNTLALAYENGIKAPGADALSYADGPVSYIPFGPLQMIGSYGTVVVSMRVGANLSSAVEIQRLLISLQTPEGQWTVTEAYKGSYYVYDFAPLSIQRVDGQSGYTSTWDDLPVTVSAGDGKTYLYRLSFEQRGIYYTYEIQSLSGNQMSGRWQFSWSGGTSSWETFQAQRRLWFP